MESRYSKFNQQASSHIPQSSNYSYFTEQARRAGYMRPELEPTRHEHLRDHFRHHHHHHHPLLHPHPLPQPLPYPVPHPGSNPHDRQEAIQREIEKQIIREEIIMSELARRRVLEAEVRSELMMERELALQRGNNGFPFGSSCGISTTRITLLGRREGEGLDALPFQRQTAHLGISEVKHVSEGGKEKKKLILLAKPDVNTSGSKRKATTPPLVDSTEHPLKKKATEEWSCALCQVSATSERALNEHLKGKKHKSKEASLRSQRAGKNIGFGHSPKKAESFPFKESLKTTLKKTNSKVIPKVKHEGRKNIEFRFWCEMCQIGSFTRKIMDSHKNGKKHVKLLQENNQMDMNVIVENHRERVGKGSKKTIVEIIDKALDEPSKKEDHDSMDAIYSENQVSLVKTEVGDDGALEITKIEPVDESKTEDSEAVDITKPENDLKTNVVEIKEDELIAVHVNAKEIVEFGVHISSQNVEM